MFWIRAGRYLGYRTGWLWGGSWSTPWEKPASGPDFEEKRHTVGFCTDQAGRLSRSPTGGQPVVHVKRQWFVWELQGNLWNMQISCLCAGSGWSPETCSLNLSSFLVSPPADSAMTSGILSLAPTRLINLFFFFWPLLKYSSLNPQYQDWDELESWNRGSLSTSLYIWGNWGQWSGDYSDVI